MTAVFQKAREFTDVEVQTLDAWALALAAGLNADAKAVLGTGLYVEHLRSLLDANRAAWSHAESHEYAVAGKAFHDALNALTASLAEREHARATASPEGHGAGDADATGAGGGYGES